MILVHFDCEDDGGHNGPNSFDAWCHELPRKGDRLVVPGQIDGEVLWVEREFASKEGHLSESRVVVRFAIEDEEIFDEKIEIWTIRDTLEQALERIDAIAQEMKEHGHAK